MTELSWAHTGTKWLQHFRTLSPDGKERSDDRSSTLPGVQVYNFWFYNIAITIKFWTHHLKVLELVSTGLQTCVTSNKHVVNCMNSSRADSRVSCLKTSDVSETHSISILRESHHFPWGWRRSVSLKRPTFLINWQGYQPEKSSYDFVAVKAWRHITLLTTSRPSDPETAGIILWKFHFRLSSVWGKMLQILLLKVPQK
jgi:hypothetical protein